MEPKNNYHESTNYVFTVLFENFDQGIGDKTLVLVLILDLGKFNPVLLFHKCLVH